MKIRFAPLSIPEGVAPADWGSWGWQMRHALTSEADFAAEFRLSPEERAGFVGAGQAFEIRCTPYYARLASRELPLDPIRRILMPTGQELIAGLQQMRDPLGERQNSPVPRIVHRYPDRCLLLATDACAVYCRYCTRKHFTAGSQSLLKASEYDQALSYIKARPGLREVILSGGDPLTLGDRQIERVLADLRSIEHVEVIRIHSRMPVVCPMRVTPELARVIQAHHPVFVMTHFNHPRELTADAARAISLLVDHGAPVFNQLVLLNGVNNSPAIVQALSRRLLFLRAKPYYMFQCDPSEGTDHLRTSIDDSLSIQRELWGRISGLAMPNFSVDIPSGGGKAGLVPDFEVERRGETREFVGWDGVRAPYVSPAAGSIIKPLDDELYREEWEALKRARG
jgi:lysine 2,3-aminomutase